MAVQDDKRPDGCVCDCSCGCNDNDVNKAVRPAHILGDTHNSIDLWVSSPVKTKWIFVEEEVGNERTRTG